MNIDFSRAITNLDGKPVYMNQSPEDPKGVVMTLGRICGVALSTPLSQDENGITKLAAGALALKLYKADGPISVTVEDISLAKKHVEKNVAATYILFQVCSMLEGEDPE